MDIHSHLNRENDDHPLELGVPYFKTKSCDSCVFLTQLSMLNSMDVYSMQSFINDSMMIRQSRCTSCGDDSTSSEFSAWTAGQNASTQGHCVRAYARGTGNHNCFSGTKKVI